MKTIKEILYEAEENKQTMEEVALNIETIIKKYFKDSHIKLSVKNSFGIPSILLIFTLGKSAGDWKNGIPENDPIFNKVVVSQEKDGGYILNGYLIGVRTKPKDPANNWFSISNK